MLSALVQSPAYARSSVEEGFDVWRKSVVGVELERSEGVPPTLPAPSAVA